MHITEFTMNPNVFTGRMAPASMKSLFLFVIILFILSNGSAVSQQETWKGVRRDRITEQNDTIKVQQQDSFPSYRLAIGRVRILPVQTDQADLDSMTKSYLDAVIAKLNSDPSFIAIVAGHSDNHGTVSQQEERAMQRAKRVRDYLTRNGAASNQIVLRSYGARMPVSDNRTTSGRVQNNRVEIKLIKKK
jgi:outer membrane protein OmpA-like peptidoglycan-associated protein